MIVRTPLLKHAVETGIARRVESVYDSGVVNSNTFTVLIVGMGDIIIASWGLLG